MKRDNVQYIIGPDLQASIQALYQRGGKWQKAAEKVLGVMGMMQVSPAYEDVFRGLSPTNHGESRIPHCTKYDLTGFCRLVTTFTNGICEILFVGDHDTTDKWLEKNKGRFLVAETATDKTILSPIFKTDPVSKQPSQRNYHVNKNLLELLPKSCLQIISSSVGENFYSYLEKLTALYEESQVLDQLLKLDNPNLTESLFDALEELKSGNVQAAVTHIEHFNGQRKPASDLTEKEKEAIVSSGNILRVTDIDPTLFKFFAEKATFKEWMLYLHHEQKTIVDLDFPSSSKVTGVSGSGKTCILIHRAMRLAKANPEKKVLILTLNEALAVLIKDLIKSSSPDPFSNLKVQSVFGLCQELLIQIDPNAAIRLNRTTAAVNQFATSEHIDEIWDEYYFSLNNNSDSDVFIEVIKTLNARGISAKDYIRQEMDFIRSAFSTKSRQKYLAMERRGRVIPLDKKYRQMILDGLAGWERLMNHVGAIDDLGIVDRLHDKLSAISEIYDYVLVDEVQDLGTLELSVIRKITREGSNDLFLCGDEAQTVHTKYCEFETAGVKIPKSSVYSITQNYRNSRQILEAAQGVLLTSYQKIPLGIINIEILKPEYTNFHSARPLLLSASSIEDEIRFALGYARSVVTDHPNKKVCIILCGYSQNSIEELATSLSIKSLTTTENIDSNSIYLSDLEQTKGFEFDSVIILNCSENVIPHPELPENERFFELSKLYVALTRAKTELILSTASTYSPFLSGALGFFCEPESWEIHTEDDIPKLSFTMPSSKLPPLGDSSCSEKIGKIVIRYRDAIGLTPTCQDELISHVTGSIRTQKTSNTARARTIEWARFDGFYSDMQIARNRNGIISEEVWTEISNRYSSIFGKLSSQVPDAQKTPPNTNSPISIFRFSRTYELAKHREIFNTIAAICTAQGVEGVDLLSTQAIMDSNLLNYLLPKRILKELEIKQRLVPRVSAPFGYRLTSSGKNYFNEFLIASPEPGNGASTVSPADLLNKSLRFIKTGATSKNESQHIESRLFTIGLRQL